MSSPLTTMSTTMASSALEVSPVLLMVTVNGNDSYLTNATPTLDSNKTTDAEISDNGGSEFESYALYKVTVYIVDYYLWVVLAFGLPGNLASVITIMSMPTISSSKVNLYVLRHRTGSGGLPVSNQNRRNDGDTRSSSEIQEYLQNSSESANKSCRCNNMVLHSTMVGKLKSLRPLATVNAHVAVLAIADTIAIIMKVAYWQISLHRTHITGPGCALFMFVLQFTAVYVNWVVVAMTAERFLAVWLPLRVGRMYTRRKAFIVLATLGLMTAGVFLFFFWAWTEGYEEGYGYWCHVKHQFDDFLKVFYWIEAFYSAVVPCLIILVGNTLIIVNIKRARKAQRHLTNSFDQGGRKARDQRQITLMLVVVSLVFLLLNVPIATFYMVKPSWTFEPQSYDHAKYYFTSRFVHMLQDANHAVNFYLYFLSMSTFRRRFMDTVRCKSRTKRRPTTNSSVYRTSQTYLHGVHHGDDSTRPDSNSVYTAYKRSTVTHGDNNYSMKSYSSNNHNNRVNNHNHNNKTGGTASSEV